MKVNGLYLNDMVPNATVCGAVEIFENAWPTDPYQTISMLEQECSNLDSGVYWEQAETLGAGANQNLRTNRLMKLTPLADLTKNSTLQTVNNMFYTLTLAASNSYSERFGMVEPFYHEGYNILKYCHGQEYKAHYDNAPGLNRTLSAICYLNDDYEGGELEFVNFGIKIKPKAGMFVLFPSGHAYKHIAHPITAGTKYALVTWIRNEPNF